MARKLIVVVLAAAVLAGGIALVVIRNRSTVKMGVIFPLTGPDARVGLGMRNAVRLAVDEMNERGGVQGKKVALVELDEAPLDKAEANARKLVEDKRVIGAVVHYGRDASEKTAGIFAEGGLPNILGGIDSRTKFETMRSPVEFRLLPLGTVTASVAARYAWEVLGARKFAYVHDDTATGEAALNAFRGAVSPFLHEIAVGGLELKAGEAANVAAQLKATAPDYILCASDPKPCGELVRAVRAAGLKSTVQLAARSPAEEFLAAAGPDAEGSVAVFHGVPPESFPEGRAFLQRYAAHGFSEPASDYSIYAYAAAQALLGAMDKSFLTRPSLAGAISHEALNTALGQLRFFYLSSTYQTVAVYRVTSGKWAPVMVTNGKDLKPFAMQ